MVDQIQNNPAITRQSPVLSRTLNEDEIASIRRQPASPASKKEELDSFSPAVSIAPDVTRMVILVPDEDVDEIRFVRKIWALVPGRPMEILFAGLIANRGDAAAATRRLALLASLTRDPGYTVSTSLLSGSKWVSALEEIERSGDLVVCHAEQKLGSQPVCEALNAVLERPVVVFSGLYSSIEREKTRHPLAVIGYWAVLVAIIAAFSYVEIQLGTLATGWLHTVLFLIAFLVEFASICVWNRFG